MGNGTNTISYFTYNSTSWTGLGTTVFSISGNSISNNGVNVYDNTTVGSNIWVAVGQGTNTIAYSQTLGTTWVGLGTTIFSVAGNCISYGGASAFFIAVGQSDNITNFNTIVFSANGTTWFGNGNTIFYSVGNYVLPSTPILASGQNILVYVNVGSGSNTIAYSINNVTNFVGTGTTIFTSSCNSISNNDNSTWVAVGSVFINYFVCAGKL